MRKRQQIPVIAFAGPPELAEMIEAASAGIDLKAVDLDAADVTTDKLTAEDIKGLWTTGAPVSMATLLDALGEPYGPFSRKPTADETRTARARCAEIINARRRGAAS